MAEGAAKAAMARRGSLSTEQRPCRVLVRVGTCAWLQPWALLSGLWLWSLALPPPSSRSHSPLLLRLTVLISAEGAGQTSASQFSRDEPTLCR